MLLFLVPLFLCCFSPLDTAKLWFLKIILCSPQLDQFDVSHAFHLMQMLLLNMFCLGKCPLNTPI